MSVGMRVVKRSPLGGGRLKPKSQIYEQIQGRALQAERIIGAKTLGQEQASYVPGRKRTSTAGGRREGSHLWMQTR